MSRTTKIFTNITIALVIILALVVSAWGTNQAAAQQSPDAATFTAAVSGSAAGSALVQADAPAPAQVGDRVTFTLRGSGAQGLAGFQFAVQYDDLGLGFLSAEIAPEWKAAGYGLVKMGPVHVGNMIYFGALACPVGDCSSYDYNQPRLAMQALPADVPLVNLNFEVRQAGTHAFTVSETNLVGESGLSLAQPQAAAPQAPDLTTMDVTVNGVVNDADAEWMVDMWARAKERGGPCITPAVARYDLDGSGCIDLGDAQMVLNHWGESSIETAAVSAPTAVDAPLTFTVNSSGNGGDTNLLDSICATEGGSCTLRAAIQQANAHAGRDTIAFDIGACNSTATIISDADLIVDTADGLGTIIDGYTQCGASANTKPVSGDAKIKINIQGTLTINVMGIYLKGANNLVRGLAVYDFDQQVYLSGARSHGNVVEGTFVGTDAAEEHTTSFPDNESNGIDFRNGAHDNRIGGAQPGQRVLVSGNDQDGINLQAPDVTGNVVVNTYVGLKQDGSSQLRNSSDGVDLAGGSHGNTIGGLQPGERNVIGGNKGDGIEISHDSTGSNQILGNWIGLQADGTGTTPNEDRGVTFEDAVFENIVRRNIIVGNGGHGVRFYTADTNTLVDNFIGVYPPGLTSTSIVPDTDQVSLENLVNAPNGTRPQDAKGQSGVEVMGGSQHNVIKNNIIANHPEYGVLVTPEHGYLSRNGSCNTFFNTITENWIYNNERSGIRLTTGTDTRCGPDPITGNQGIAKPVITAASNRLVTGTTCANCKVEVFQAEVTAGASNPGWDNAGGEGKIFLGSATANASGAFSVNVNISALLNNVIVTATATDPSGNTSEFARNVEVTGGIGDIGDHLIWLPFVVKPR